jgi:hypothetical protein
MNLPALTTTQPQISALPTFAATTENDGFPGLVDSGPDVEASIDLGVPALRNRLVNEQADETPKTACKCPRMMCPENGDEVSFNLFWHSNDITDNISRHRLVE